MDVPGVIVLFNIDAPKFSLFKPDACFGFGDDIGEPFGFGEDIGECFGFGEDRGERVDPMGSIALTLSREEFRRTGGSAPNDLGNAGMPLPSGGSGAYKYVLLEFTTVN